MWLRDLQEITSNIINDTVHKLLIIKNNKFLSRFLPYLHVSASPIKRYPSIIIIIQNVRSRPVHKPCKSLFCADRKNSLRKLNCFGLTLKTFWFYPRWKAQSHAHPKRNWRKACATRENKFTLIIHVFSVSRSLFMDI